MTGAPMSMGNQQIGQPALALQRIEQGKDFIAHGDIQRGDGFVEDYHLRRRR